jgi:parallel beta-helix repeat protein
MQAHHERSFRREIARLFVVLCGCATVLGCGESDSPADDPAVCGDGHRSTGEQCDGTELGATTCEMLGFAGGGSLACSTACQFDTSGCMSSTGCAGVTCVDSVCVDGACVPYCPQGPIVSACACDGSVQSGGYCCSGKHQTSACSLAPACSEGEITGECDCGGAVYGSGYCCSDAHQTAPCSLPACDEGEVLATCTCGTQTVSTGYCCQETHQASACDFAVYYVSNSGDDANAGTSASAPWKSLAKVHATALSPADAVLFRRGDEWAGTLTISASGTAGKAIVYGAYGTGAKPKLYGSEPITGWTQHAGSIYTTKYDKPVSQLFLDGARLRVARYPNAGYIDVSSLQTSSRFMADSLDATLDYVGATWLGRTNYWIMETKLVTVSASKTLTLDSAPSHDLEVGQGFFLMNKLAFLDQPGEWFHDSATSTIYLWTPNGDSPDNYTVRGSVHDTGIYADNRDHVTIRDLNILQQRKVGIHSPNCDYFTIRNNQISLQEEVGIRNDSSSLELTIADNVIRGINGIGIWLWDATNLLVTDNQLYDMAVWDGLGTAGLFRINAGSAMEIHGTNHVIRYNRIVGTGGVGIFYRGAAAVEHNFIQNVCLIKDDGGGIYTNTAGSGGKVRQNIVLDAIGTPEGFTSTRALAECIYIDEIAANVTVENNTLARCTNSGIKLHKNEGSVVRYNTIMDARQSIHVLLSSGTAKSNIHDNIMFAASATDDYLERQVFINSSSGNASYDYNTYVNPYAKSGVFRGGNTYYDFAPWQSYVGGDSNSTFNGSPLLPGQAPELFYNDTKATKSFPLSGSYRDLNGNAVASPLTLQPFTSQILMKQ